MRHLLVTNDFPPKTGGIQSYLWELWRRLPAADVTVLTTPHAGSARFDAEQAFRIDRTREPVLLPNPVLTRHIRRLAEQVDAELIVLDPAVPLGLVGPSLGRPYAVVLHGSEVTVPGRLPASRQLLTKVLRRSSLIIAAGGYPEAEARRAAGRHDLPPIVQIPPGVDTRRFVPLPAIERARVRARLGVDPDAQLVLSLSRLVPRKGMDTLIAAGAELAASHPSLEILIGGTGRDRGRLEGLIHKTGSPARLLGWVGDADLADLYACADLFVLCCRERWGGLEQEGFGIIFLEAASAGLASVAGRSGGAAEAVVDGETGIVVDRPSDPAALAAAMQAQLDDPERARGQGAAARTRAEKVFGYDRLAGELGTALERTARPPGGGAQAGRSPAAPADTGAPGYGSSPADAPQRDGNDPERPQRHGEVDEVEEKVTERMVIRGTPEHCFGVLTDFPLYPDWAADIKAVTVVERDGQGRASLVTFRAAAFGRSTSYTLRYDYGRAPEELSWVQVEGDITRRLDGAYRLESSGDGGTEIHYDLVVDLKVPLPGFVKRRAEGRIMGTALRELRARVEGDPGAG